MTRAERIILKELKGSVDELRNAVEEILDILQPRRIHAKYNDIIAWRGREDHPERSDADRQRIAEYPIAVTIRTP